MSDEQKRAWCESSGHIIVEVGTGGSQWKMDVAFAENLAEEIIRAIREAKMTPFDRWWNSLPAGYGEDNRRLIFHNGMVSMTRDEGEKLFSSILEVR